MNDGIVIELVVSGILYGTPLLIAALGELLAERSGVLNLGIEGMMLMGAVAGFWVSQRIDAPGSVALVVALVVAAVVGALMATIHAVVCVSLRGNQIVSGLALTIFGGAVGLSSYLSHAGDLGGAAGRHAFHPINVFDLKDLPIAGPIVFNQNALVYLSWGAVLVVAWYVYRTRPGLHLRAVGEQPASADAMGINVSAYRYTHTIIGGALAGIAGACYSLAISPSWTDGLTAGAGWIALALVIFAFWRPALVLIGAYLFGTVTSLGLTLQGRGVHLPPELFSAFPYIMTIIVLVAVSGARAKSKLGAPTALGTPYARADG